MLQFDGIVACICEGASEQAIMELLLENNILVFDEILDDKIIRTRSAKNFENEYLRKGFKQKITILRILDSRNENFKLSKLYEKKVSVINVITAPEIEMLIIHAENKYEEYKKTKIKPSDYCKINLRISNVKSYEFIREYFSDIQVLIGAIQKYKKRASIPKGEYSLYDLLKD